MTLPLELLRAKVARGERLTAQEAEELSRQTGGRIAALHEAGETETGSV